MSVRILVADDHKIFRDGLRRLLDARDDLEVVAEAASGLEVLEICAGTPVDLVVVDISMPGLNGVDTTRKLMERENPPRVVALSMHDDRRFVTGMLRAGASAYLLKDCGFPELRGAIDAALRGEITLSKSINASVLQDYLRLAEGRPEGDGAVLTPREREILQLIAEGDTTKEIADALCVSVKTVESHRKRIMDRLDLHSVAELTKFAIREGLTSVD